MPAWRGAGGLLRLDDVGPPAGCAENRVSSGLSRSSLLCTLVFQVAFPAWVSQEKPRPDGGEETHKNTDKNNPEQSVWQRFEFSARHNLPDRFSSISFPSSLPFLQSMKFFGARLMLSSEFLKTLDTRIHTFGTLLPQIPPLNVNFITGDAADDDNAVAPLGRIM
ncbi:hypothetical protein MG293_017313 [Ovis ammon polii]|uniref:Uncharacterized protein n=1 Tax=Ovis ammon polii TaxID=230172 RepID=A0AAD4TV79_OVIAM|nr:hypothetical protein MG293_017313 [Ovis ammon polii]